MTMRTTVASTATERLLKGDRVRLKSLPEIQATLDAEGRTAQLPFMREMLAFRGRVLEVEARADKTCDTINLTGCDREMSDTVHLVGARCDGSAHGGCQAFCLLFFNEAWLERVPDDARAVPPRADEVEESLVAQLDDYANVSADHYRCQATQLLEATRPMEGFGHYLTDIRTRNVPWRRILKGIAMAFVNYYQKFSSYHFPKKLLIGGGRPIPDMRGSVKDGQWPDDPQFDLLPGDLVEVRSRDEIRATLDADQRNRGLWFDAEMAALCGKRGRVLHRVEKLIDEKTGRMLTVKKDLYMVAGMVGCEGIYHKLCTRSVMAMMREAWLRKVD